MQAIVLSQQIAMQGTTQDQEKYQFCPCREQLVHCIHLESFQVMARRGVVRTFCSRAACGELPARDNARVASGSMTRLSLPGWRIAGMPLLRTPLAPVLRQIR